MKISTNRLTLRELREKDFLQQIKHLNNLEIAAKLSAIAHPYTRRHAKGFYDFIAKQRNLRKRSDIVFAITLGREDVLIGCIGIHHINYDHGTAEIGYWLAEAHWGKGIMTEAVAAVLDFCFGKLALRRIDISVFSDNPASKGLIEKMGFTFEGIRRKRIRAKATAELKDEMEYGLLKEEWSSHRQQFRRTK